MVIPKSRRHYGLAHLSSKFIAYLHRAEKWCVPFPSIIMIMIHEEEPSCKCLSLCICLFLYLKKKDLGTGETGALLENYITSMEC